MKKLIAIGVVLMLLLNVTAGLVYADKGQAADDSDDGYYRNSHHGYWWYETIKEDKEKVKKDKKQLSASSEQRKKLSLKDYTFEQVWNMYPDDFQKLLKGFLKQAVQEPSEENVTQYYILQDIARRKALMFTNVTSFVMNKYGFLNLNKDNPMSALGSTMKFRQQLREIARYIDSAADEFALLYFYKEGCPYCMAQDSALKHFLFRHPTWQIKKINYMQNQLLAASFGVDITPSLVLIYKYSEDYFPVSYGFTTTNMIERNIYRGIKYLKGEAKPENWTLFNFQKGGAFDTTTVPEDIKKYFKQVNKSNGIK